MRALVLGAGGYGAIAWETGVIVGMADEGIDVRNADVFIGTSAGACVAAQVTSGLSLEQLFKRQVDPVLLAKERAPMAEFKRFAKDILRVKKDAGDEHDILRRIGALAVESSTISETERKNLIALRLPTHSWSAEKVIAVAVDVENGQRRAFDWTTGMDIVDAVAASCALPGISPAITIGGRRFMDGGIYSTDNADLAIGADRVLILTLPPRDQPLSTVPLDSALRKLKDAGAQFEVVHPDEATLEAFASVGGNILDPEVRESAARAGRRQGRAIAARVALLWTM